MSSIKRKRIRKTPDERKREIAEAAARLISRHGFNGISLREVADEVGMSQPGLLHYVGSKDGLLSLLITDIYDMSGTPEEFLNSALPGSNPDAPHFPAYLRYLVAHNASRRMMVQLYIVLEGEAFNPDHPLHDYFSHRSSEVWERYSCINWVLPVEYRPWNEKMRPVVDSCIEAIDGIQHRWLRDPPVDFCEEWLRFEKLIFPQPQWRPYL